MNFFSFVFTIYYVLRVRNKSELLFIPVWTGSGLERVYPFGEEQTTITCTIDTRVIIQDVSSVGLQMIGR